MDLRESRRVTQVSLFVSQLETTGAVTQNRCSETWQSTPISFVSAVFRTCSSGKKVRTIFVFRSAPPLLAKEVTHANACTENPN